MQLSSVCVFLFVAAMLKTGESIRCYSCVGVTGLSSTGCMEPFNATIVDTCDTGSACSKSFVKTGKRVVLTRSCGAHDGKTGCDRTSYGDTSVVTCTCKTDLCNGASFQRSTSAFLVALIMLAALVVRWH